MKPAKVVLIGAASASFGPGSIQDAMQCKPLHGGELVLVDLNAGRLEVMARLARRIAKESGVRLDVTTAVDRRRALEGADFVITSIAMNRNALWRLDWEIPRKYGFRQVLGENGGPGGLFHTLRNVPVMLAVCRDMEELCPDAWLINYTNPESRVCLAINRYTRIKAIGLCHGIFMGMGTVADIVKIDHRDLDIKAAGLNHFLWALSIHRRSTGEDLYPLLRERAAALPATYLPLTIALLKTYGLIPFPSDDHIGEYLGFAFDVCRHTEFDFEKAEADKGKVWDRVVRMAAGDEVIGDFMHTQPGESAFDIIGAMLADTNVFVPAVNILNQGCIANLPADAVVEVPAMASAAGIYGLSVGALPSPIAALCQVQVGVQRLAVEAAFTGCRQTALHALLADPVVHDLQAAEQCLDEMLAAQAEYLPQFGAAGSAKGAMIE